MNASYSLPFLRETLLFLVVAGILIPLLQRWRINQVLGFLVVGLILGPYGIALWAERWPMLAHFTFSQGPTVKVLAELGVIFLMFLIGLELSAQRMWALRRWVFGAGLVQVVFSALAIGALAYVFGNSASVSVVLGLVLSLSSTAIVMQLLNERHLLVTPLGQAVFSVLMLQDLMVVPVLIFIDLIARPDVHSAVTLVGLTLAKSVLVIVLIYLGGKRLIAPVFRSFARQHQPEIFVALTLLATLSIAGITAAAGLSMALGAFLAGLLLAETEYRHEIEVTLEPFKGLLMGLFFMSVGMGIDVREVAQTPYWLAAAVLGLLLIKSAVVSVIFRLGGLRWGPALEGGLLLGQGGEFAFVVLGYAVTAGLLNTPVAQFMLLVVGLSLLLTPLSARLGAAWRQKLEHAQAQQEEGQHLQQLTSGLQRHVVIVGCGRVGQLLAEVCQRQQLACIAVDHNAAQVMQQRQAGLPVYFGNAARAELLHKLHCDTALALVVTMDNTAAAMHTVKAARLHYPHLPIYARSHNENHARELLAAGATAVVPEALEAGLQLAGFALHSAGLPATTVSQVLEVEREQRRVR